jgi:hypothetical protein
MRNPVKNNLVGIARTIRSFREQNAPQGKLDMKNERIENKLKGQEAIAQPTYDDLEDVDRDYELDNEGTWGDNYPYGQEDIDID